MYKVYKEMQGIQKSHNSLSETQKLTDSNILNSNFKDVEKLESYTLLMRM